MVLPRRSRGSGGWGLPRRSRECGGGGPFQCRPIGVRRIGGGEGDDLGSFLFVGVRSISIAKRTQQVERAWQRKLRRAQSGDKVTAAQMAALLHRLQYRVNRTEAAWKRLGHDGLARQHPVPREELLCDGGRPSRPGCGLQADRVVRSLRVNEAPASFGGGQREAPRSQRGRPGAPRPFRGR